MAYYSAQYTMTATATQVTTVIGRKGYGYIEVKSKSTNTAAAKIFIGGVNVTATPTFAGGEIAPGEWWSTPVGEQVATDEIYLVGTAGDVAYVVLVE